MHTAPLGRDIATALMLAGFINSSKTLSTEKAVAVSSSSSFLFFFFPLLHPWTPSPFLSSRLVLSLGMILSQHTCRCIPFIPCVGHLTVAGMLLWLRCWAGLLQGTGQKPKYDVGASMQLRLKPKGAHGMSCDQPAHPLIKPYHSVSVLFAASCAHTNILYTTHKVLLI